MKLPSRPRPRPSGAAAKMQSRRGIERQLLIAHPQPPRQYRPQQAAVKRHAALPEGEDLQWLRQIVRKVVEDRVAQPAAQHDADGNVADEFPRAVRC